MKSAWKMSFFILCLGAFLNWMGYGLVYPIFAVSIFNENPIFLALASKALQGFWLGVLIAASPTAQFFSAMAIGALSDRMGRKPVLQISFLVILLGYLLSAFGIWERSFLIVILGRVITGVGAGNISAINASVADISEHSSKARNFALIAMANGIGFAIGPLIGGKLSAFGYGMPFIFAGLLTLLIFILTAFWFKETLRKKKTATTIVSQLQHLITKTVFQKFRVLFPAFFLFCFGWSYYWEFIPVTWIKNYGLDASQIGNFYAYGAAFYALSSGLLIRPIVARFQGPLLLFLACAALGGSLLPLAHAQLQLYWFLIPIQQFLIALIFPVGTAIVSNAVPEDEQGQAVGGFQSLQAFAFAATPFFGGMVSALNYNIPLVLSGAAMFLASLVLLFYKKKLFRV
jgi:DHA1 family tetracycline resistance protein-like MFS transporter